jgi:hypothetical protein
MPLTGILKNKLLLQKQYGTQELSMDNWPYWMLEENIKIGNEIIEELKSSQNSLNLDNNLPKIS